MADIRINALATTAASTASDDYIAIDGSANGTRKLDAYSPTFGGNLTVSGAGNSSVAGNLGVGLTPSYKLDVDGTINTSSDFITQGNNARISIYRSGGINYFDWASGQSLYFSTQTSAGGAGRTTRMILDSSGNLTVSGTGTSTFAGPVAITSSGTSLIQLNLPFTSRIIIGEGATNNANPAITLYRTTGGNAQGTAIRLYQPDSAGNFYIQKGTTDAVYGTETYTTNLAISSAGNLLIGTTTDGGQKLQVSGTAYVSGDATFAGSATIGDGAAKGLTVNSGSGQNLFVMQQAGTNKWIQYLSSGSLTWYNNNLSANALTIDTATSNATFAGSIAIGNTVNTVSPTSPNRTITMVIGGTTYYIHAKTTND